MKKYDSYKDSGIEWIGEIPLHWQIKRVKHTTYVKGRIGWQGMRSDEFLQSSDSYVVTGTDFEKGRVKWETCYQVPMERYEEDPFIQLRNGDLLITKDGTIGKVAVVKDIPKIATLNSGVFLTRPIDDSYVPEFMFWILYSDVFKTFYDYNKSGSTIQHLYQNVFNEFKFPLPSINEQTTIANYLDQKTRQIDNLIAKKEALTQLLEEERTVVVNNAVTKGLDTKVPMKDSGIEWLGDIPEHWKVKKIKFIAILKSGENITSESIKEVGDYPVYGGNGLRGFYSEFTNDGDYILIGRQGALCGNIKYARNRFWASEHAIVCYLEPDNNWLWFGKLLESMNLNQYNQSAAQPGLAVGVIKNLSIPFPSIEYQNEIVEFIIDYEKKTNEIVEKTKNEIGLLKEYKIALISEVVTGKVNVRDENLN
ncbi:restriction endonuclease subunit S [Aquirufa antheringensis]|uniref:restriction endonuclease subunit S n=1 Tax=Aquirufa antheringensis TaxID=2516559 RepID=UPI001032A6CC|nr:restriction endonuclease subunit S [Aquirufa antheringensis]TBH71452.1 hypothetical protein EWU21_03940 [Aquirufa antheringensis]